MKRTGGLWSTVLVACLVLAAVTLAVDVEVGDQSPGGRWLPPPLPPVPDASAGPLRNLAASVTVGRPREKDGFRVFPLHLSAPPSLPGLLTLDEALAKKLLEVTEEGPGTVPSVRVSSRADRSVFLLAGEILLGGKQDRIVRQDVIVPSGARDLPIPVYCGEQGRWTDAPSGFQSKSTLANQEVRKRVLEQSPQAEVWSGIERTLRANAVATPTGALQSLYEDPQVRAGVDRVVSACLPPRRGGVVGLAVARGGRVLGADLFGDPDLFARLAERVLRAYVADALRDRWLRDEAVSGGEVERLLRAAADAEFLPVYSPGAGRSFFVRGWDLRGGGITLDDRAVHLAVLR